MRIYTEVEVQVDAEDVIDQLSGDELRRVGLIKLDSNPPVTPWHDIRDAMRRRDSSAVSDLLAHMAWDQAGIILPVGLPPPL